MSVREDAPEITRTIFTKFLCMIHMAVTRSFFGRMTKAQGEGTVLGFSSQLTVHCK